MTTHRKQPRGAVLVAALVCMLIVMALVGSMLERTLRARRQLLVERDLRQTQWLLQAGLDRAAFRLARESDYRGETWKLPAGQITGRGEGQVAIAASRVADGAPWQIKVVAEYPLGNELSIQRSHTFLVQLRKPQPEE
jgi:type II secretory pathway component PulK